MNALGPHASHLLEVSFACGRSSHHWFTLPLTWAVLAALLDARIETDQKDHIILCPGPLTGGKTPTGTRKIKEHVEGLDVVFLDFDKGDAPLDRVAADGVGPGECCLRHLLASERSDGPGLERDASQCQTGQIATLPSALQTFARARHAVEDCTAEQVTAETIQAFMVEEQGFEAAILGPLKVIDHNRIEKKQVKTADGWQTHETRNLVVKHAPLAKSRVGIPLATRFARQPGETTASFQDRWQRDVYLPLGELIGFRFDRVCASTERGHTPSPAMPSAHLFLSSV